MGVQTDMSVPRGNTIIVLPLAHPDATELQRANLALRSVNAHLLPVSFGNFEDEDPLAQASEVPVEENPTAPTISSSTPEHVGTSSLPAKEWPTIHVRVSFL